VNLVVAQLDQRHALGEGRLDLVVADEPDPRIIRLCAGDAERQRQQPNDLENQP